MKTWTLRAIWLRHWTVNLAWSRRDFAPHCSHLAFGPTFGYSEHEDRLKTCARRRQKNRHLKIKKKSKSSKSTKQFFYLMYGHVISRIWRSWVAVFGVHNSRMWILGQRLKYAWKCMKYIEILNTFIGAAHDHVFLQILELCAGFPSFWRPIIMAVCCLHNKWKNCLRD